MDSTSSITEIGISISQTPLLWSNNLGAQALLACNPVYHARTKHIKLDVHNLISDHKLDMLLLNLNLLMWLQKPLPLDRFRLLCSKLTMSAPMLIAELAWGR